MKAYTGSRFSLGVSSGTAGLHLCVRAAGIGINEGSPGDLVITTPFSFVASANVLLFEQAVPVFVDVDPVTGNINPALVEQAAADLMGDSPDFHPLAAAAWRRGRRKTQSYPAGRCVRTAC